MIKEIWQVWKQPREELNRDDVEPYWSKGVYPAGELMAASISEKRAREHKESLENDAETRYDEEPPYVFTLNVKELL